MILISQFFAVGSSGYLKMDETSKNDSSKLSSKELQKRRFTLSLTTLGGVITCNCNLETGVSNFKSCLFS